MITHDLMSVGEENETFLIRAWKPLPNRHVLKSWGWRRYVTGQSGQYLLARAVTFSGTITMIHCLVLLYFDINSLLARLALRISIKTKWYLVWQMTSAVGIEDVRREVKILKALSGHKNLVQFHDAFEDANNIYMVMEYVLIFLSTYLSTHWS